MLLAKFSISSHRIRFVYKPSHRFPATFRLPFLEPFVEVTPFRLRFVDTVEMVIHPAQVVYRVGHGAIDVIHDVENRGSRVVHKQLRDQTVNKNQSVIPKR